ncbi:MAG: hypothetical protein IKQ24_06265, partial [Verrucomicrobia bacterium]|nr:hypothetical protein [Verrucomicrobiota bacterium]
PEFFLKAEIILLQHGDGAGRISQCWHEFLSFFFVLAQATRLCSSSFVLAQATRLCLSHFILTRVLIFPPADDTAGRHSPR